MENEDKLMSALQEALNRKMAEMNSRPLEDIDNLSPIDMHQILYNTFGEESPIAFKEIRSNSILDKIPILNLFEKYLNIIKEAKELKLTTRGNLPRKICFELYGTKIIKEDLIESGIVKLSKEEDSIVLQNLKIIGDLSRLTKKRNNKISLTQKGLKLLTAERRFELLKTIFKTNYEEFNLGYHDGYSQKVGVQRTFGYTLYLLLRYGEERRELNFYAKKNLLAFPFELDNFEERWSNQEDQYENCLGIRIFERFMNYYGLIDYHNERYSRREGKTELQTTPLFRAMFELRKNKFRFKKNEHLA